MYTYVIEVNNSEYRPIVNTHIKLTFFWNSIIVTAKSRWTMLEFFSRGSYKLSETGPSLCARIGPIFNSYNAMPPPIHGLYVLDLIT